MTTMLILEDDPAFSNMVEDALRGLFDSIHHVTTWEEAEKFLDQNEVAWVDLRLPPDIHEPQALEKLADLRARRPNIVIVVGSGFITPETRAKLARIGVDGVFTKDHNFLPQQVAAEILAAIMQAARRDGLQHRRLLDRALAWHRQRFPNAAQQP